jgi:hypothetical protein
MVEHRGKVHDYLGMILDYLVDGHVIINMVEYVKGIISNFPEDISATKCTLVADHLFNVREDKDARPLPEEQAREFITWWLTSCSSVHGLAEISNQQSLS